VLHLRVLFNTLSEYVIHLTLNGSSLFCGGSNSNELGSSVLDKSEGKGSLSVCPHLLAWVVSDVELEKLTPHSPDIEVLAGHSAPREEHALWSHLLRLKEAKGVIQIVHAEANISQHSLSVDAVELEKTGSLWAEPVQHTLHE